MAKKRSKATRRAEAQAASARAAAIRREYEARERRRRTLWISLVVLAVIAIIVAIGYGVQSSRDTTGQTASPPSGAAGYAVPFGQESAPVTITVYEDFMCPYCGQFEAASRPWVEQYVEQGKLRVEYHVLAFLDRASNGTEYSTRAANALAVVLDTSGPKVAKKFHDLLYEHQPEEGSDGLSDAKLIELAVQAGAKKSQVSGPIESVKFEQWVENGTDAASKHDVTGTPTVELDGKRFTDFKTMQELSANLKAAVDAKLKS